MRVALVGGGLVLIVGGVLLLTHGSAQNAARLGRLAGILILLGILGIGIGAIGRL